MRMNCLQGHLCVWISPNMSKEYLYYQEVLEVTPQDMNVEKDAVKWISR